ncbi:interleukin-17 receptor C isoform X3 [Carassius gibelio]|uniref:interleukin-17 receptor C isoform X3 n=1 Tax=Carassius gibelio TaxID=101364 RepID=UPI002277E515|nr:interleukin-17 receptor C isoform X3 [Carassius gibelio]
MKLTGWIVQLLLLAGGSVCSLQRVTHNPENNVICPQSLNCSVRDTDPFTPLDVVFGPVFVCSLAVKPKLCCQGEDCKPCLWISIQLSIIPALKDEKEGDTEISDYEEESSGDWDSRCLSIPDDTSKGQSKEYSLFEDRLDQGRPATITICYQPAEGQREWCKRVDFKVTSAASRKLLILNLVEYKDVTFGRTMKISVGSFTKSHEVEINQFPTLKTVCSLRSLKDIKLCKGPRVSIKREERVVKVLLDDEDERASEGLLLCMKRGREGRCSLMPDNIIPLESITYCMCLQAWRNNSVRVEICPFEKNETEFKANVLSNMSVSLAHIKSNVGEPVLSWNLTAPCRIRAEAWPCQLEADGTCTEVKGFRQNCCNDWTENSTALWASGKFVNIRSQNHKQLCLMLEVDGKIVRYCQHPLKRQYWSLLVLLPLILLCLTTFGVLLLKWSLSEWDRRCHSQDMRGQVLLLHSSATDPQLVCKLGQLLSELGFRVFLDLWNQTELGSCGPAAWLHSKLDHIQKHGGKALLVLSPSTLQRAELYWKIAVERQSNPATYSSDMLASALGCIFADRQKGCAAQRFVLVQLDFDELPINEEQDMPKLLRGLLLYKLPSQSQGLLMELCLENPTNVSGKLKKMWWMRKAQRKLAQGVQNILQRVRTDSMLTQSDLLSLDMEDTEEIVFLKKEQH